MWVFILTEGNKIFKNMCIVIMEKATLPVNSTIFDSFLLNQLHQINLVAGIGPIKKQFFRYFDIMDIEVANFCISVFSFAPIKKVKVGPR